MAKTYEPIVTTTLSSSQTTITFDLIPNTYTDLRLIFVGIGSLSPVRLRLAAQTSGYSQTFLIGNGTAASSSSLTSQAQFTLSNTTGLSTTPVLRMVDIFSYTGSINKTVLIQEASDLNGSGSTLVSVGQLIYTSAITRIDINGFSGTLDAGTTATLYGIKAA